MAKIKKLKFKGFTIIEALVSLSLITITLGMAFMVFDIASKDILLKRNYPIITNNIIIELENGERELKNQIVEIDNSTVEVKIEDYQNKTGLKKITVIISRNNKIEYQTKVLKIIEE